MEDAAISFHVVATDVLSGQRVRISHGDAESAVLREAFERAAESGTPELVLVSGYAGIGKSSLVRELVRTIAKQRGRLIGVFVEQGIVQSRLDQRAGGRAAEQSGHGPRLGQALLSGRVGEVLDLLGRDQAIIIRVDQREVVVIKQVIDRDCAFDRGDGVSNRHPGKRWRVGASGQQRRR